MSDKVSGGAPRDPFRLTPLSGKLNRASPSSRSLRNGSVDQSVVSVKQTLPNGDVYEGIWREDKVG